VGGLLEEGPDQPYEFLLLRTLSPVQKVAKRDVLHLTT
jgi:hypothetical protein